MNYNTDKSLWASFLKADPDEILFVKNGNIWAPGHGSIGQFSTTKEAIETLKAAGYPDNQIDDRDAANIKKQRARLK